MASTHAHELKKMGIMATEGTSEPEAKPDKESRDLKQMTSKKRLQQTINGFSKASGHQRSPSEQHLPMLGKQTASHFTSTVGLTNKSAFMVKEKDHLHDVTSLGSTNFGYTGGMGSTFGKTGFKNRTKSVANLAATLGINQPDSRFMLNVSNKDAYLNSFVEAGNKLTTDEKVAKVANRSQFWEGNSGQLINKPLKNQMNYLKDWKALDLLQDAMEKSNQRDIRVLEDKQKLLTEELNRVSASNKAKEARKEVLATTLRDLGSTNKVLLDDSAQTLNYLAREMKRLENTARFQDESRVRMDMIIEVCKINQVQNVDWIRGLEYYSKNLRHVMDLQSKTNSNLESDRYKVEQEIEQVKEEYLQNVHNHNVAVSDVSMAISDFRYLKENIYSTNEMVRSRIEERNHEVSEILIGRKRVRDKETFRREHQLNEQKIKEELDILKKEHGKYEAIFKAGKDGQNWDQKPEVQTLIAHLESDRAMNVALFHKQSEIDLINRSNQTLQDKINVHFSNRVS